MTRTVVGLDIGSSGVRAAEFVPGRRRTTLRRYASVPLEPGIVRIGGVVDGDGLTAALKALWAKGKFGTKEVRIGIANGGVLVRQLDLDWMPPVDFRQALRYQVQSALPIHVAEANLDYHLLDELDVEQGLEAGADAEPRRVARILLVAADRDMVDAFVEAAHRAGLRATGVDLLPFALVRVRTPSGVSPESEPEAIVDIGSDVVSVVVHTGGVPRYVRIIPGIGGDSITEAVQQRYDWTWEDAERTKIFVGLPGYAELDETQREIVGEGRDGLDHPAQRVVVGAARGLADEISTTLNFYRDSTLESGSRQPATVSQVLLTGSGARLAGLDDLVAERVGVTVTQLDAASTLHIPRKLRPQADELSSLAVTAGLCIGAGR